MSSDYSEPITADDAELNDDVSQGPTKRIRKLTSKVWDDFVKFKGPNGNDIARCKHCNREFVGESRKGTSHLKNHLSKACPVLKGPNAPRNASKAASESTPKVANFKFDQERSRMDFSRMVIKHNYPFNMAEHEFFEIFCNNLQPMFKLVSRNTVRADVLDVYEIEKAKLYQFLDELSSKITLTTDIWTSDHQNFAYTGLTAHYVTNDWELKKKILAYRRIDYPHDEDHLFSFIKDLILE
ncbi:zinc finger BED domain-containing protein DAYSLEEPER-like [Camellia sinensis]|uniref:zinc finger BED domain-containing protein DAYSLEEPER-like n=1 Tax=Camellia sinensis TaxID=4442 RepID=UPI001035A60B|nr:zinc finger BED domain-containing protein DAYSLEEPER-like [Camellia sinensis]